MANQALTNLAEALLAQGGKPFALDAAFLTNGLNDPAVAVPEDYDSEVARAFQVGSAAEFLVTIQDSSPTWNGDNQFRVDRVSLPILATTVEETGTLVFSIRSGGGTPTLVVQIDSRLPGWTWTDSFPFMNWPFSQFEVSDVRFIFSTATGKYPWDDESGPDVTSGAVQNFFSSVPLPEVVKPVLVLFSGLKPPTGNLDFFGTLNLADYNGETVLYPSGEINGVLSESDFEVFYLQVSEPAVQISIPPPATPSANPLGDDDGDDGDQVPSLSVASGISIGKSEVGGPAYELRVSIMPTPGKGASASTATEFNIGLTATGEGTPLSPATITGLVGGVGSYFGSTPPVLQQYLAAVSLQGLSLSGNLGKPELTSVTVRIGSSKNTSWTPIPDPTGQLDFTITEYALIWSITNPLDSKTRQQRFLFQTEFTLLPAVFKGPGGVGDGIFRVEFNSGLQFFASFDGTASLSDFLSTLTAGAVSLPSSINATLSDIRLALDYSAKSFAFSSGFHVTLDFLEIGGKPVLSVTDGLVRVAAKTATQDDKQKSGSRALTTTNGDSTTVWQSGISGLMAIGPLAANVDIAYDGFVSPPRWNLSAALAEEIQVQEVIQQFFDPNRTYDFPDFLPGDLRIKTFAINAVIPSGTSSAPAVTADELKTSYSIDTTFSWLFRLGGQDVGINPAHIKLDYDGAQPDGKRFSGLAEGTWVYEAINLELLMGYQFQQTTTGSNKILFVEWEGFRAEYQSKDNQIVFSLKGWSIGSLIQALVRTLGNPWFVLPAPWDLLNKISLDGLRVNVSLESGQSFSQRLSASYELSSPLNLGFINIKGLRFFRTTERKVNLALDAEIPGVLLDSVPEEDRKKLENLTNPDKGQDTKDMPSVPGRGPEYFKLFLLVLGQRVSITGYAGFETTQQVIEALADVPKTTGKTNPVNPNADQGSPPKGLPYYDEGSNWLIAAHLGILKVAGAWTIDAMVVFNDPNLYGMRLALAGPKAGGLSGLAIDVIYKKITDDIGVFQIEFTFPDSIRNLNFGAVSITLPQIGIKIYTNGDFFIDIGFPYNLDFRRSFSIAAIVYGVPVLGSGGFYFGKLSNATATQVPKTNNGTFDPVIVFGIGLQLGLGYNFTKGPLSAGFSLTVFGIVEGVYAPWHPYDRSDQDLALRAQRPRLPGQLALTGAADSALQSDYYFKLSGTVGVIGLLYGKIDFAIIQASLNVKITLSLQITYESYRAIPLVARATVDVSLKVKINLGLFSISVSLSFSADVSAKFVIGSDQRAPWDDEPAGIESFLARRTALLGEGPVAVRRAARNLQPRQKRVVWSSTADKPQLKVTLSPPFTVLAPENATDYPTQEGAFVCLLVMDSPDAASDEPRTGETSFDQLCAVFFPWVIDTLGTGQGSEVDLTEASATSVSRQELERYIEKMADLDDPPLDIKGLLEFMESAFTLDIDTSGTGPAAGSHTLFPVFDGLSLAVPDPSGKAGAQPVDFETYTTATSGYRKQVATIFAEVQADIEHENDSETRRLAVEDDAQSMASVVFVDSFLMIGRQLLQAALDLLDSYAWPLAADSSIAGILDDVNGAGNHLNPDDVALPNQTHPLSPGIDLATGDLEYVIQAGDTLSAIATKYSDSDPASRWSTTAEQLILANGMARMIQPNIELSLQGSDGPVSYTTGPGEYFDRIATALGISLPDLAGQAVLYTVENFLKPAASMTVPSIRYTTAPAASSGQPSPDTLTLVATRFGTTTSTLADHNLEVAGLFSVAAENGVITLANLTALSVSRLWNAIQTTDQVAQSAGMVSRFLMYGLRLPRLSGLTLSEQFLYPAQQKQYALYQLTGQQFPTPAASEKYELTISRADSSHGVDLTELIRFNGAATSSGTIDLTASFNLLTPVLDYARDGKFLPAPSLTVEPLSTRMPKAFPINRYSLWSTSDLSRLEQLTRRNGVAEADEGNGSQKQPILWPVPASLFKLIQARQACISGKVPKLVDVLPLLPELKPQVGSTSPAGNQTVYRDVSNWAWTTRVDFEIRKIPSGISAARQGTGAGSTPSGPASSSSLPNIYEVVGPSSEDSRRLEQLLSAMDELGEDLLSSVSLLYSESAASAPKLVTLGSAEFLAFLTQTNLSTETNPARSLLLASNTGDGNPPRGIANPPGEFVKLLWELSVVRSGGYYLFYQVVDGGEGLPSPVFDSSGTAILSMVVTYSDKAAQLSVGDTMLNCMNSFVTTDEIDTSQDIMRLVSEPASGLSAALTGSETLNSISACYGPGPGQIAHSNSTRTLTAGKTIPVSGIVRQLVESDLVDPDQTLENLAIYYSRGAVTPITAGEIQAFNPGVSVGLGAVFFIPPIEYRIAATSPGSTPGDQFTSIAAYYGVDIDTIATLAADVAGLFPSGDRLKIDSQLFDLRSTLGPGNLGIRLERVNPGPADPNEMATYPEKYLYQMYNTLSAGWQQNVYFDESPLGLPFGPQSHDEDDSDESGTASHAGLQRRRQARLLAAADKDFVYRQSLGFGGFALVNAAPNAETAGLPARDSNPYIGVGSAAQVALRWQDIFGNTTVTPFDHPPAGYTGALNGQVARIRYNDRLIGMEAWPNVQASYIYAADDGTPRLRFDLTLDTSNYNEVNDQVRKELALFQLAYFQLHQDYTGQGVPGVTGNAVSMSITNSLLDQPVTELSTEQSAVIRDFVAECVQYLDALVNGTEKPGPPRKTLELPLTPEQVAAGNIIELDVTLVFTRQRVLTEPDVAALDNGLSVSSDILPQADGDDTTVAYTVFARQFESIFQSEQWEMKVGEGLRQDDAGAGQREQQLWAARFGKTKGEGIYFEIGETPGYYAPAPIARSLRSKKADIVNYETGESVSSNFSGVDLNLWFQTCLDAIDRFLSADYSSPAFILDQILGTDDPLENGYLGQVLQAKQSLADTIASTVTPVLSTSVDDSSTIWAANEKLRQQLLNELGAAYKAGTVAVYGLRDVSGAPSGASTHPPGLYGQPAGESGQASRNQNFTLSPAKIPLGPVVDPADALATFQPRLAFVATSKNLLEQAYVPLETLKYRITHLEFERVEVAGIKGYVQSRWMQFVSGPFDYSLGDGTANVPIVNRALPVPPTVQSQSAGQYADPETPADLARWDYSFEYLYHLAPGDAVQATIELNYPTEQPDARLLASQPDLFDALAQFVSSWPAILADLNHYLLRIDAEDPDTATVDGAKKAVETFASYVTDVSDEYRRSLAASTAETVGELPALVRIEFEISLQPAADDAAQTDILNLTIDGLPAVWNEADGTISTEKITLPAFVIEIDPENYEAYAVQPSSQNVVLAYQYRHRDGGEPARLPYTTALAEPLRKVRLPAIDVLAYQNGWSEIFVQRNKILFPVSEAGTISTEPTFLFQTPTVRFSDPIIPRLAYPQFPLARTSGNGNSEEALEPSLNKFFESLFSKGNGSTSAEVTMAGNYSYRIQPELSGVPRVRLPVNLLPPTETAVDPAVAPAFTAPLATTINAWREANDPTQSGDPQINFMLQVFGASGSKQPLIVVDDLQYDVTPED